MKRTLSLGLLFLLITSTFTGCKSADVKLGNIKYAGLDCVVAKGKSTKKIMELYQQMQEEGKKEGYCPLIILHDTDPEGRSILDEWLDVQEEDHGALDEYVQSLLNEYPKIDAEAFLKQRSEEYFEDGQWADEEAQDIDPSVGAQNELYTGYDGDIYIAKVPTDKPYEVLAYIPMGGFNECPPTEEHIALAKQWYEKYGAVPCAVSYDTVQYYLDKPVTDEKELEELAGDQYMYCIDIVLQGVGSFNNLKQSLNGSKFWFFWWD